MKCGKAVSSWKDRASGHTNQSPIFSGRKYLSGIYSINVFLKADFLKELNVTPTYSDVIYTGT